mgnify:CR=1 FL=1
MLCPLYRGASVHFARSLKTIVDDIQSVKATILLGVPLLFDKMFKRISKTIKDDKVKSKIVPPLVKATGFLQKFGMKDVKKKVFKEMHEKFGGQVRIFIAGGAAPDPEVAKGLRDFGFTFIQGYGLTETAPIVALNRLMAFKDDAAGLPLPGIELKISEPDPDGVGEVLVKGKNVMLGYYKNEELTKQVFQDGYFKTGDLGYIDSDGFLHIRGRQKNVIIASNGKNVFPEEIEDILNRHPLVLESFVFGEEDSKHLEIIAAQIVLNAETQIHEVELRVYKQVCERIRTFAAEMLETAGGIARLDCVLSLASVAAANHYVRPLLKTEKGIQISAGRHPVVERIRGGERYVPNDLIFEPGEVVRIITGPNMSGKSTFLRQAALIILMAQIGSFVPADSAEIGLVDRVFTRIGAQDAIHAGQSTFMVEMIETANILNNATPRSLVILDEIGRGTSTYDGLSIAWAIIEYLHSHPRLKPYTLFATHYHELTELAELFPGVRNYNVAVTEADGRVIFLHQIVPGGADRSYGIHVAQLAGLPAAVIQRANEILKQLEATSGKTLPQQANQGSQLRLFPENNPLIESFKKLDLESLTPIQALNLLYEWRRTFFPEG